MHRQYGQTFVNQVRNEYNRALQRRETERITFNGDPHTDENPDYIWFSELGYCPLKAALRRKGAEPKFPELKLENDDWLLNRLDAAVRLACSIQEAFLWKFGDDIHQLHGAAVERRVVNHEWKATGRADILFWSQDGLQVYEIKHRREPVPHIQDCWQAMGYALTLGASMAHIIIIGDNGWPVNVWSMVPQGDGYLLMNEDNQPYPEIWNTPERISYANFQQLIAEGLGYLSTPLGELSISEPPIRNPLESDTGWQCIRSVPGKYPSRKLGTPGLKRAACEFGCHSPSLSPVPYWLLPDGSYSWTDPRKPF